MIKKYIMIFKFFARLNLCYKFRISFSIKKKRIFRVGITESDKDEDQNYHIEYTTL